MIVVASMRLEAQTQPFGIATAEIEIPVTTSMKIMLRDQRATWGGNFPLVDFNPRFGPDDINDRI